MENLYDILGCDESDSYEVIKASFQKLIRIHHPDKSPQAGSDSTSADRFIQIDNAWKILRDPRLRKQFDTRWKERCLAQTWPIQEDVAIEDFEDCEDENDDLIYPCRCGGSYLLTRDDVEIKFDIVCCDSCSLSIRTIYNADYPS